MTRRGALVSLGGAVVAHRVHADEHHSAERKKPFGWVTETIRQRTVLVRGEGPKVIVLLHELNGLSPGTVDFGVELVAHGFKVYIPLLFGHVLQDAVLLGTIESCWFGGFKCTSPGGEVDTKPVRWVGDFVRGLEPEAGAIGVVGMCETGAFPIATMRTNSKVKAVVLSQPALPVGGTAQRDVGISPAAMKEAKASGIPILAFRFKEDTISTCDRMEFLKGYFGNQIEIHQLDGPADFQQTWTHRLHAVLTGAFDGIREEARGRVIAFMESLL